MIVLTVMLLLVLLWLGSAYMAFRTAQRSGPIRDHTDTERLMRSKYAKYADIITEGVNWNQNCGSEPWEITSADGLTLHAEWLENPGSNKSAVLVHGWRSSAVSDFSITAKWLYERGWSILFVTQRAHAKSEGRWLGFGVSERQDCLLWTKELNRRRPEDDICLFGMSMGSTTVLMAAGLELPDKVRGVVADCGFTSPGAIVEAVARGKLPFGAKPMARTMGLFSRVLAKADYDHSTVTALKSCRVPVLLIHGTGDTFVPSRMSEENFAAIPGEKELVLVEGAEHGESGLLEPERVFGALERFLQKILR